MVTRLEIVRQFHIGAIESRDLAVGAARRAAVVIGILAIIGGIFANGQNIAFLVALAFAVAARAASLLYLPANDAERRSP